MKSSVYSKNVFLEGQVLLIDKPLGWSSFDVVKKIKHLIRKKYSLKKLKVGHAGTLDPLATGLLIVCTGKFTKKLNEIQSQEKTYTGTITLGGSTPSYDLETEINNNYETKHLSENLIYDVAKQFVGEIDQKPPIFSAIKQGGERLYKKARRGEKITIQSRKVFIKVFKIISIENLHVTFKITCSKGTYIRSIANDFGKKLNSGAYLSELRRTAIGNYALSKSVKIETFEKKLNL